MNNRNKKLLALTTAALALPGVSPNQLVAQSMPEKSVLSYRHSAYEEAAQRISDSESIDRYEISVHQLSIVTPVSSKFSLNIDASTESMSGASPWFVLEGAEGEAVQVMSGATIQESRDDVSLATSYYGEKARYGVGLSRSEENDYESTGLNINTSFWFNEKNTVIDFGVSGSADLVNPTPDSATDPSRDTEEKTKDSQSLAFGISQTINKTLLVAGNASYAIYEGYLSDPYKLVSVDGDILRDSRPSTKEQAAIEFKLRKYLAGVNAALHTDYRYYTNNWGVESHTMSLGWYQNFGDSWQMSAKLRGYDQIEANFFRNFFIEEREDGYYSSDYRLSGYGAISYRLGLTKTFETTVFRLTFENYDSGENLAAEALSPGLVDFSMITGGIDYKF